MLAITLQEREAGVWHTEQEIISKKAVAMGTGCQMLFCEGGVESGAPVAFPKHGLLFSCICNKNNE